MRQLFKRSLMSTLLCSLTCTLPLLALNQARAEALGNWQSVAVSSNSDQQASYLIRTDRGHALRISIVNPRVFRLEAGWHGEFAGAGDQAAAIVIGAGQGSSQADFSEQNGYRLIRTAHFALRIYPAPLRLALYQADNQTPVWRETQPIELAEGHSFQTLSRAAGEAYVGGGQQNGQFVFRDKIMDISYSGGWEEGDRPNPAPFYASNRGYGVLRNTWSNGSYDFRAADSINTSHQERRFDAYYLLGDLHQILSEYTRLTGPARLLPRWAFEYGDADCYNDGDNQRKPGTVPAGWSDGPTGKTPDVVQSVAAAYRQHDMPGGWILPNDGYGCGYSDLPATVKGLAGYGFHTGLWTENGVDKIAWEVGTAGTRAQKLDVAWTGKGYQFSLDANQAAAQGILNNSDARPFIWTVMGWAGTQRYAVTWTGDQSGSWDYIRWHIPTLIGSGLSGQAYATGDVDGIFGGSPESFTRDLQWKSFTPVLMGMSGWSRNERKHPWWFEEPYRSINRQYLKLKMRLMPYMYTYAQQAEQTGAPLVRGLMWDFPQDPHAFDEQYKYQFMLGRDFLVAPVYQSQIASRGWRKGIYLPAGRWIDYWDGRVVDAPANGRLIDQQVDLQRLPVMIRAGAILPMYPAALYDGQLPKDILSWDIYPYGQSSFTLYEDDGSSREYQRGQSSRQTIRVNAPTEAAGNIDIELGPVQGSYRAQEQERVQEFMLHTRVRPQRVEADQHSLIEYASAAEWQQAQQGWYYDSADKYGTVHIKLARSSIRLPHSLHLQADPAARLAVTAAYPAAPALGEQIASDAILVLNRPPEEPGHPLENAFDGKPDTWFRTVRDQTQKTGPHEFSLALGERRMVKGFVIAGRTGQHWEYGQVKDVEIYLADNNGEWGEPVYRGRLKKQQGSQTVNFAARPGRLLRFRILSTHDQNDDGQSNDPMILNSQGNAGTAAFNAGLARQVAPVTISEFAVLEQGPPDLPQLQLYLSDLTGLSNASADQVASSAPANPEARLQMNGLRFGKGLGVAGNRSLQFKLQGQWQSFRADVGIDDACRSMGGVQFQVWGDGRLLFDSGMLNAPAVLKPEIDVRGVKMLKLSTTAAAAERLCADWANARLLGYRGDQVEQSGQP